MLGPFLKAAEGEDTEEEKAQKVKSLIDKVQDEEIAKNKEAIDRLTK